MKEIQNTFDMLFYYIKGVWIKKRYIMICSWLICPVGLVYVTLMPDTYRTEARVFVDTRSILKPLLEGLAVNDDPQQQIRMMARTLLSRPNLERIARETDMDIQTKNNQEFEKLIDKLSTEIRLRATGGRTPRSDNIYVISYENQDPNLAYNVVQKTLDLFVGTTLGESRQDTDSAARFLDQQLADYEKRLSADEQRLADFKRKYSDLLPGQGTFYSNLNRLKDNRDQVLLELKETEQQTDSLRNKLEAVQSNDLSGVTTGEKDRALRTRFDVRIEALQQQLDQLSLRYTELHPDVVETKNLLETLEVQRDAEIEKYLESRTSGQSNVSADDPFQQELALEISRLEGRIASLRVRESDHNIRIQALQDKIDQVPLVEAELTSLNREYDITKQKYEQLLSRRESATISRNADVSNDEVKFRVVDPARVPILPSGPNRPILYTLVIFVGFGLGLAVALLVSQLTPVIINRQSLERQLSIPVFGSISHAHKDKFKRIQRIRLAVFAMSSSSLVFIYISLVTIDILGLDLVGKVQGLIG